MLQISTAVSSREQNSSREGQKIFHRRGQRLSKLLTRSASSNRPAKSENNHQMLNTCELRKQPTRNLLPETLNKAQANSVQHKYVDTLAWSHENTFKLNVSVQSQRMRDQERNFMKNNGLCRTNIILNSWHVSKSYLDWFEMVSA